MTGPLEICSFHYCWRPVWLALARLQARGPALAGLCRPVAGRQLGIHLHGIDGLNDSTNLFRRSAVSNAAYSPSTYFGRLLHPAG